jgi:glycosyltransferase involved in cell wall biosynthesis
MADCGLRMTRLTADSRQQREGSTKLSRDLSQSAIPNPKSAIKVALYNVTTTTKVGGVETFVWEVAGRLAARGYRVDVIGGRGRERWDVPGVRVVTLPYLDRELWRRIPLLGRQYTLTKLLERLSLGVTALPLLLLRRYRLIHIQKPYDLPIAALARLGGTRALFGCHGKDFWLGDRLFVGAMNDSVSCSAYNAGQVRARYHISPTVIYNGVDLARFTPDPGPTDSAVLATLGVADDLRAGQHNLLYAGRLVRWKGVEYLIEALPQLQTPDVRVWIAGQGPYQPDLEALAARLGVADRIRWLGTVPQEQLPALYRAAAVLVGTSFVNETFGIALAEAQACGRPVVASRFGGFPEVVEDGVTGLLCTPQDAPDLAAKLDTMLADPERAAAMGAAGRARVLRLFTWDAVVDRLEAVYTRVLNA